ncbi:hypothetical protein GQ457_08G012850 [Hibiscus cannabinus]
MIKGVHAVDNEESIYNVKSVALEGMKANKIRTVKMAMGSSKSMEGGGGNGGSIKGRMSKDAVRHVSSSSDSNPKYLPCCNDLLLPPSYSPFFLYPPALIFSLISASVY